jgi:hypothetical protein
MPTPILIVSSGVQAIPFAQMSGTIVIEDRIYILLGIGSSFSGGTTGVLKSIDGGATWFEQHGAGAPTGEINAGFYNPSTGIITVAWRANGIPPLGVALQDFDTNSDTWGAAYGSGSVTANIVGGCFRRPDGSVLIIYSVPTGTDSALWASVWDGASWTSFDAGINIESLPGWDAPTMSVVGNQVQQLMDSTGRVHLLFYTQAFPFIGPEVWSKRCFYQAIETDNSLGSFFDFPGQDTVPQDLQSFSGGPIGRPVIVADNIVLPVLRKAPSFITSYATLYIGTGLSNPSWTEWTGDGTDPNFGYTLNDGYPMECPYAATDGESIAIITVNQDPANGDPYRVLRISATRDLTTFLTGWMPDTFYSQGTAMHLPTLGLNDDQYQVTMENPSTQYWLGAWEFRVGNLYL